MNFKTKLSLTFLAAAALLISLLTQQPPLGPPARVFDENAVVAHFPSAVSSLPQQAGTPGPGTPDIKDLTAQIRAAAYWFFPSLDGEAGVLAAGSKTQRMGIRLDADGLSLRMASDSEAAGATWSLKTPALQGVPPVAERDRVTRRRGRLEEWFHNAPRGLEHGFVLHAPDDAREERLAIKISGPWRGMVASDGRSVSFHDEHGVRQLGYDDLRAWDATGRDLPARMELTDASASLTLCVDTRDARWPVTIDPVISTGSGLLKSAETTVNDGFGLSIFADGNWLIAGAPGRPNANGSTGAVYFFQFDEVAQTWVERQKIGAPLASNRRFGERMALSAGRLAVFASAASGPHTVHFVERTLTGGTLLSEDLTLSGTTGSSYLPPMALEGEELAVGKPVPAGGVRTYRRVLSAGGTLYSWLLTADLTPSAGPGVTIQAFGSSLALRGGLLAVGAPDSDNNAHTNSGTVHFFERSGPLWVQTGWFAGASSSKWLGTNVAIMDDGTGLAGETSGYPTSYALVRDGIAPGGWKSGGSISPHSAPETFPGLSFPELATCGEQVLQVGQVGQGAGTYPFFASLHRPPHGSSTLWEKIGSLTFASPVSITHTASLGSNWIAATVTLTGLNKGVALWRRSGSVWAPVTAVRAAATNPGDHFGSALACDGRTLVVGAPERENLQRGGPDVGAVYVFVRDETLPGSWKLHSTLLGSATINGDRFGAAVALHDKWIAVAAPGHNAPGAADAGQVCLFERNGITWTQTGESTSTAAGQQMGAALVITDAFVIAGAPGAGDGGIRYLPRAAGSLGAPGVLITVPGNSTGLRAGAALHLHDGALVIGGPARTQGTAGKVWLMPADGAAHATVDGITVREFLSPAPDEASFGTSVAAGGGFVFAGAPGGAAGGGRVWRFDLDAPGTSTELYASSSNLRARGFGAALAWSGDRLVVGAPETKSGESPCGAVFIQETPDFVLLRRFFTASHPAAGQRFGAAVCAAGGFVCSGAPGDGTAGDQAGAAFTFQQGLSDWSAATAVSVGNASQSNDRLGESVAIDGDFAVIGAPGDEVGANPAESGAAYVLSRRLGWAVEAQLSVNGLDPGDEFGKSVAISGQTVIVGAPRRDGRVQPVAVPDVGRAFIFTRAAGAVPAWTVVATLTPAYNLDVSVTPGSREFGESVDIDGDLLVVGAPGSDSGKGRTFLYGRRAVYDPAATAPWTLLKSYQISGKVRQGRAVAIDGLRLATLGEDPSHVSRMYLTAFDYDHELDAFYSIDANEFAMVGTFAGDNELNSSMQAHLALDGPHLAVAWANDNNGHLDFFHEGKLVRRLRNHTPNGIVSVLGHSISLDGGQALMPGSSQYGPQAAVLLRWQEGVAPAEAWSSAGAVSIGTASPFRTQVALSGNTAVLSGLTSPPAIFVAELSRGDYDRWRRRQFTDVSVDNPSLEGSTWGDRADPDKDGMINLAEAYRGSSPVSSAESHSFFETPVRAGNELIIRWRESRTDHGVIAVPQWSPDLTRWYLSGDGPDAANVKTIPVQNLGSLYSADYDTMEARLSIASGGRAWFRLLLRR